MTRLTSAERKRLAKNIITASYMSAGFSREYGHDVAMLLGVVDAMQIENLNQEDSFTNKIKNVENYWKEICDRKRHITDIAELLATTVIMVRDKLDSQHIPATNDKITELAERILEHCRRIDEQERKGG